MKIQIKKESFNELIDSVVRPSIQYLYNVLEDKQAVGRFLKDIKCCYILLLPFSKEVEEDYKKNLYEEVKKGCAKYKICPSFFEFILPLYENWLKKHAYNLAIDHLNFFKEIVNETKEETDFFDLDEECVNKTLETMHYKDKIKAKDFVENVDLDFYFLEEIKDLIDDYFTLSDQKESLDYELIETLKEILSKFISIFMLTPEFENLAKSLEKLYPILEQDLNEDEQVLLKLFIDSIMYDLNKWYEEVILYKSANDIHYLDASLYASIEQMMKVVNDSKKTRFG